MKGVVWTGWFRIPVMDSWFKRERWLKIYSLSFFLLLRQFLLPLLIQAMKELGSNNTPLCNWVGFLKRVKVWGIQIHTDTIFEVITTHSQSVSQLRILSTLLGWWWWWGERERTLTLRGRESWISDERKEGRLALPIPFSSSGSWLVCSYDWTNGWTFIHFMCS